MYTKKEHANINLDAGFSLIEIMVSLSLFIVVIVISMGSILSVLDANRKSQSLRATMDNLNFTIESMTRTIRFGTSYHCGQGGNTSTPQDCPSGTSFLTVQSSEGDEVSYQVNNGQITRSLNGSSGKAITSPDVTISEIKFYVFGSQPYCSTISPSCNTQDELQPQVIIVVTGFSGVKPSVETEFTIQTTVSQRFFDFQ